ncbi:MAG: lysophospholipid acyltransferase family protein [Acidobacteriota bacterium]
MADRAPSIPWGGGPLNRGWLLALGEALAPAVPRQVARALAEAIAEAYALHGPEVRRSLASNLRGAFPDLPPGGPEELAIRTLRAYARGVADYLRAPVDPPRVVPRSPAATERMARQGGKVLVTAHLGNWEVGGAFLAASVGPHWILGFPERDPDLERFRSRRRERQGHHYLPADAVLRSLPALRSSLERGESAVILADRAVGRDRAPVVFRGRPAHFLRSPALLAALAGVPLVPTAVMAEQDGTYSAWVGEPARCGGDDGSVRAALQGAADFFGAVLERYPDQWYNFYPYWQEGP